MVYVSPYSRDIPLRHGTRHNVLVTCVGCAKEFWKPVRFLSTSKRHFCTKTCFFRWYRGPNNDKYRGGRLLCQKKRRAADPTKFRQYDYLTRKRRREIPGSHTLSEWEATKRAHAFRCAVCNKRKALTRDHIIPVTRGGSDDITNIQPLCLSCNASKGNRPDSVLVAFFTWLIQTSPR